MQVYSYLTFNGNCREAMTFYKKCLGGELTFQTIGDSPFSGKMPKKMKEAILQATLTNEQLTLMASDIVNEKGLIRGNGVSIMLHCNNEVAIKKFYDKLSSGGQKVYPLEITFWGALFGELIDRFENHWLLHCPVKP